MSKGQHSNKEAKKKPLMNAKEKRMAKQAKKHSSETTPIITRSE